MLPYFTRRLSPRGDKNGCCEPKTHFVFCWKIAAQRDRPLCFSKSLEADSHWTSLGHMSCLNHLLSTGEWNILTGQTGDLLPSPTQEKHSTGGDGRVSIIKSHGSRDSGVSRKTSGAVTKKENSCGQAKPAGTIATVVFNLTAHCSNLEELSTIPPEIVIYLVWGVAWASVFV